MGLWPVPLRVAGGGAQSKCGGARPERGRDAFYESCDFVLYAQGASGVRGFALYDDLTICYVLL